jgi:hypothetical protein
MTTARLPYVIDALVSLARAATGHRDPESTATGIPVFDGPQYGITSDRVTTWLAIGWSGEPDAPQDAAEGEQTIGPIGNVARARDERGEIPCRALCQTGDRAPPKAARDVVFAEMAVLENITRTNPTLGLDPSWMRYSYIMNRYSLRQENDAGSKCTLDFTFGFRTRI